MSTKLVIPDAGPLISLALADRLDLLDKFIPNIIITDIVEYETVRKKPGAPGSNRLSDWMEKNEGNIIKVQTTAGEMLQAVLQASGTIEKKLLKNAGELSILEFVATLRDTINQDDSVLVLYEDDRVRTMDFGPDARKITTWGFLIALENMGVIESADFIVQDIAAAGRNIPMDPSETPPPKLWDNDPGWSQDYDLSP